MKTTYLKLSNHFFSYLFVLVVLAFMSSCSQTKYTASFQSVPSKNYAHAKKTPVQNEAHSATEQVVAHLEVADVIEEEAEIPQDLTASLNEMGFSAKKTAKIQKRLEKLSEAIENRDAAAEPAKLSFAERMVVKKALKKADKILSENNIKDVKDLEATNKTQQRGNVTLGLILILAGILVAVLVPAPGAIIGSIVAAVGLVLLIVGLL